MMQKVKVPWFGTLRRWFERPIAVVIVRLAGTNVEGGRKILAQSGLPIIRARTLAEAAKRAVTAWQKSHDHGVKMVVAQ